MLKATPLKFFLLFLALFCYMSKASGQNYLPGKKVKSMTILEEKHDQLFTKTLKDYEVIYDERGNIIEETNYKQGKIKSHFKYYYDKDNNKIKEEEFDPSGKLKEHSEYKIEDGLRVEKIVYDSGQKIKSRKIYQYTK